MKIKIINLTFIQYLKVLIFSLFLILINSFYNFYRYGYFNLYILNKVLSSVAFILLGIVLILGPASRIFSFPDPYLKYRKETGIVSFFLLFFHIIVSLFFLPEKFPLSSFFNGLNLAFIFGLLASFFLTFLFFISNEKAINYFGRQKWWKMQYRGVRIAFFLVFLHVVFRKSSEWLSWYRLDNFDNNVMRPFLPDFGLLVWWFMVFVIFIRIAEYIRPNLGRIAFYITSLVLPIIYIATFFWPILKIKS